MKTLIASLLLLIVFTSCKKDKDHESTPFEGTITIAAPAEGSTVNGGSAFQITGTISGNKEMHGYSVNVYKVSNDELVFEAQGHDHTDNYTINETVNHTLTAETALRLEVEAVTDHDGNSITKTVLFTYVP